jgi:5-methylcytosine-specific restriction endonuclease McrA
MNCFTCGSTLPKGKHKYCQKQCQASYKPRKEQLLTECQVCKKPIDNIVKAGRPKKNCSDTCRNYSANRKKKPRAGLVMHNCAICGNAFMGIGKAKYCSKPCRYKGGHINQKIRRHKGYKIKYPDGLVTVTCKWCNQPRTYEFGKSTPTAYHPKCTVEAQRARYRIKTVKRQGLINKPSRLAADQVVKEHGNNCAICQKPIDLTLKRTSKMGLTVDHWIPLSKGGSDDMTNLRPAHWICNRRKSDTLPKEVNA